MNIMFGFEETMVSRIWPLCPDSAGGESNVQGFQTIPSALRNFCAEDDGPDARRLVLALARNAGVPLLALTLAAWMYDAGRRFAGFDRSELQNEFARLRESMARLESEAAMLRSIANASESRLKIEQTAQTQLASQVKALEDENNRLKEDLAFFENLVPSEKARRKGQHPPLQSRA